VKRASAAIVLRAVACGLIAAAARYPDLASRPMHADEAIQAERVRNPVYDPNDYHGPVLQYLTPSAGSEAALRAVPATAGVVLAAASGAWSPVAGVLVALSPAMIWYSRDYIPEMLLVLWTFGAGIAAARGRPKLAGVFAGLMFATKETAILTVVCAAGAVAILRIPIRWRDVVVGAFTACVTAAILLKPAGLAALAASYVSVWLPRAVSDPKHIQGPVYYLVLLARTEWLALSLAALAIRKSGLPRLIAVYVLLLAFVYSAIPYKTPWSALTLLHGLMLLAAYSLRPTRGAVAALLVVAAANAAYAPISTWAYAETSADVFRLRERLGGVDRSTPVWVIGSGNLWPLPWYLRDFGNVQWFTAVPNEVPMAPIILATPDMEPALTRAMYELPPPGRRFLYVPLFDDVVWLRSGVELRGYLRP
jgi:hypothetical protein